MVDEVEAVLLLVVVGHDVLAIAEGVVGASVLVLVAQDGRGHRGCLAHAAIRPDSRIGVEGVLRSDGQNFISHDSPCDHYLSSRSPHLNTWQCEIPWIASVLGDQA